MKIKIQVLMCIVFFILRPSQTCFFLFIVFWPCHAAFRILFPPPGIEPCPMLWSPNNWITREFPRMVQQVKNLPVTQVTWVQSLGQKDPLEEETATHSSILAWKIPQTDEPGGQQLMGLQRVRHDSVSASLFMNVYGCFHSTMV